MVFLSVLKMNEAEVPVVSGLRQKAGERPVDGALTVDALTKELRPPRHPCEFGLPLSRRAATLVFDEVVLSSDACSLSLLGYKPIARGTFSC